MEQQKPWWQSRTILTSLLTAVSLVLMITGVMPAGIAETVIDEIVTLLLALSSIVFRVQSTTQIAPLLGTHIVR